MTRAEDPEPTVPARPFAVGHRDVLGVALPMTFAYLSTPLMGAAATAVIGQTGSPAAIGGIAVGAIVFDVIFSTFNFLRAGTTGLAAQAEGAGRSDERVAILARALLAAAAIGLLLVALGGPILAVSLRLMGGSPAVQAAVGTYFDLRILSAPFALANYAILGWCVGIGRAGAALGLQTVLAAIHVAAAMVLVLGLDAGMAGVGWASILAEAATTAFGLAVAGAALRGATRPPLRELLDRAALLRLFAINRDIMVRTFVLIGSFAYFAAQGARFGDVVLAANAVLMNVFMLSAYFLDGLAAAAEQFAGRAVGARYRPAFAAALRLTIAWSFVLAGLLSLAIWLAGPAVIDLMAADPEVRATARLQLGWAAITPLAGVLAFQMDGVFIGATWSADLRNAMLASAAIYVGTTQVLTALLGATGLWAAVIVLLLARGLILSVLCRLRIETTFGAR